MTKRRWTAAAAGAIATATIAFSAVSREASAFCGFYVSGADARLTNNATQVVLMREGTRTVLSMQNNYQGPPQDFAMKCVPVPVVLRKENVKTLPRDVFDRVDQLTAPRLVEVLGAGSVPPPMARKKPKTWVARARAWPVPTCVGADDAQSGQDRSPVQQRRRVRHRRPSARPTRRRSTWLRQERVQDPGGGRTVSPTVRRARDEVFRREGGRDEGPVRTRRRRPGSKRCSRRSVFTTTPMRSRCPIRLGLINSTAELGIFVVTILAPGQRCRGRQLRQRGDPDEHRRVGRDARSVPGRSMQSSSTRRSRSTRVPVITEYSWSAYSLRPCPTPPLNESELQTLGADALGSHGAGRPSLEAALRDCHLARRMRQPSGDFVVTRLHARSSKDALGDDLVFRAAPPIVGGRAEFLANEREAPRTGARPDATNNFQARYVIRHPWAGPIACSHPHRGVWGGRPGLDPWSSGSPPVKPAARIAFAPRTPAP